MFLITLATLAITLPGSLHTAATVPGSGQRAADAAAVESVLRSR